MLRTTRYVHQCRGQTDSTDGQINDATMDQIKVTIDREKNQISVMNNGKGIPVEMHKKEGIMIPELIFGNL
jgi:DNA topoisomerase-2